MERLLELPLRSVTNGTPDGLGHFQVVEYKSSTEVPDEEYPYFLTTEGSIFHYHTGAMTRRTPKLIDEVPQGFVEVNPEDAIKIGTLGGLFHYPL